MKKTLLLANILIALGVSNIAIADDANDSSEVNQFDDELGDFYGHEYFVSIATGTKTAIHKTPAVATVITADTIARLAATDIDEVLETVPGLHVNRSSNGNEPSYTFRGVYSRFNPQVLMLVNGFPITNMFVGNRNQVWGGMPVSAIARVEILRGPGSALYGADAFSGVINIITKSSENIQHNSVGMRLGSFNTKNAWAIAKGNLGDVESSFAYEYFKTDGYDKIIEADAQTFLDSVFGTHASLAPGYMQNRRVSHEIRLQFDYQNWTFRSGLQKRTREPGIGVTAALSPITTSSSDRFNADLTYIDTLTTNSEIEVKLSHFQTTQEIDGDLVLFPPGSDIGLGGPFPDGIIGNPEVFERHDRVSSIYSYNGISQHKIRLGIGYNRGEIYKVQESKNFALGPDGAFLPPGSPVVDVSDTPYAFLPEGYRENYYAFAQDIWHIANDWELTAGLRNDHYSDFGSTTNPRLALVWSTSLNLTSKFLYGKAFRAPSFANLYNINNPAALGNPNLNPERIETYEMAFDYHPSAQFNFTSSFFFYNWNDIIAFVTAADSTSSIAQNTGGNKGKGIELEAKWKVTDALELRANYAYQNARSKETDTKVAYAPGNQLYVEVNYKLTPNWQFNLHMNHVADRVREGADLRAAIDDYTMVNVNARWRADDDSLGFAIIAKNLFDADAREPTRNSGAVVNIPNDLPLAGRSLLLEVSYQLD
jgi:outer membrane cobalamin receptor